MDKKIQEYDEIIHFTRLCDSEPLPILSNEQWVDLL